MRREKKNMFKHIAVKNKETGKVIEEKKRLPDGKVERTKFDPTKPGEFVIDQKVKDPANGIEFIRSGSSTANQIMMQQNSTGAYISVSGSTPGFNVIKTGATNEFKMIRQTYEYLFSNGSIFTVSKDDETWGINDTIGTTLNQTSLFRVSASGNIFVKNYIS